MNQQPSAQAGQHGGATAEDRLARLTPQQRALLQQRLSASGKSAEHATPDLAAGIDALAPLADGEPFAQAPAQQRIWFFERLQAGSGAYNLYQHHRLLGALDADALQAAFSAIVARHAALRSGFCEQAGQPMQSVHADVAFQLRRLDLSAQAPAARETELSRLASQENAHPFDLARPPLLRATLVRMADDDHALLVVLHHIVGDAWSSDVLGSELELRYNALVGGEAQEWAPLRPGFPDIVRWQTAPAQQRKLERGLDYWRGALAGVGGALSLPTDKPRPETLGAGGARHSCRLPAALIERLEQLARNENATLFMVLLAAFQCLLGRHAGQDDVVVGTPFANRGRAEFEPLIGLFANTLPMRGDLSGDPSFRQLLARTRSYCLDAYSHADTPLERIVDTLKLERVPGRSALVQAMFVLQPGVEKPLQLRGLRSLPLHCDFDSARFELTLSLTRQADGMLAALDYNTELFEPAGVARMAGQYLVLLDGAARAPDCALSRLPLLDAAQRAELLALADGGPAATVLAPPAGGNLFGWVRAQAALRPDAPALLAPHARLSYAELARAADAVAGHLRALGVGPGARVALLADRSADAMVGLLGILAAGAAYLPLDPAHPDDRLGHMLDDAGAVALAFPAPLGARADRLAGGRPLPLLSLDWREPAAKTNMAAYDGAAGAAEAYVIYTSGSTGLPKGVSISHAGVINLVQAFALRHDCAGHRLLMIPPLQFDASVGDIFPVLAAGATLVLHPAPNELGPRELERYCAEFDISAIDAPAALWRRWTEGLGRPATGANANANASADASSASATPLLPTLRMLMFGGEAVPLSLVRRFAALTGRRVTLSNHYGPTEATVCATLLSTVDGAGLAGPDLPIGRPLPGVQVHVLDAHLQLAPRGVVGELCIGGAGVARGYLNAPDLDVARFVPDPFAADSGDGASTREGSGAGIDAGIDAGISPVAPRLYRSGDQARWNADGSLHFIGRSDQQVKLRGVRIELGEVEAALGDYPGIGAAVASVCEVAPGERRLVAYFVAADGAAVDAANLRAFLAGRLPDAMLPSLFQRLDALPLTVNGKVDRRALPTPSTMAQGTSRNTAHNAPLRAATPPASDTERAMLAIWSELLARQDLGVDDEFFRVGGDSLLTLPLVFRLGQAFGVEVPLSAVFAAPTVAALARVVDDLRAGIAPAELDLASKVVLPAEIDPARALPPRAPRAQPGCVFITGATGFLGAYMLRDLLDLSSARMLCLVRAADQADGLRRIRANLQGYGLWRPGDEARVEALPGDLAAPSFGLDAAGFAALAERADVVFHNGGQVNFLAPYESLEAANVGGTRDVLRLASSVRVKPVHLVSTLGVYLTEDQLDATVSERSPAPTPAGQHGGYNQSKWVAEQLALAARARGLPVALYRPARITGDSRDGTANLGDYFHSWIKGCVQLGLAPRVDGDSFDMAPVDYVSRAIVQLALGAGPADGNFHFLNPRRMSLDELLDCLRAAGHAVAPTDYASWRTALLAATADSRDNALAGFAALFPAAERIDAREPRFDCGATMAAVAPLGTVCPPADRTLMATYLRHMRARGFLPAPAAPERRA
ncbi:non-ribosomal peptide synthetase [Rugamonas rubra]|uniref:Amino acid adenylation domain-containing protein/thioester reductase domain-containing protein n=1 Tax=Rugamonas rubra TaxID=758825 RepID=A0A1I4PG39_9BURK|nr:non-ribosomal peptide synthetase [Rugamonas rubra]SFM26657.1 amino acid adenylation domain-containing protein/thioester reductase domain-containing protein [Rugamonas rubra]